MNDSELSRLERDIKELIDELEEKDIDIYSLKSILEWIDERRRGGMDTYLEAHRSY